MPKVKFLGRVLPECLTITAGTPTVSFTTPDVTATFDATIRNSEIVIDCNSSRVNPEDVTPLYIRAYDVTRLCVNLLAFSHGYGLSVILDTYIDPNGVRSSLLMDERRLSASCTAFKTGASPAPEMDTIYRALMVEPTAFLAMNDLIMAITFPHYSPIACGRAIEGIRNALAPGLKPRKAWPVMQANLRLTEDYLDIITSTSIGPRHGDWTHILPAVTKEITDRAWVIMNRFLEFRKRGNMALPEAEFPLLK